MVQKSAVVILYVLIIWGIYRAVVVQNPVFSILYLIFSFINITALLIFLSADYLAILFVLIYGGAISILIMFVVMMLDLKELEFRSTGVIGFLRVGLIFVSFLMLLVLIDSYAQFSHLPVYIEYTNWFKIFESKTNIEVVGIVLYNHFTFQFVFTGFLLFITMVVVISLVIRKQKSVKGQVLFKQLDKINSNMLLLVDK